MTSEKVEKTSESPNPILSDHGRRDGTIILADYWRTTLSLLGADPLKSLPKSRGERWGTPADINCDQRLFSMVKNPENVDMDFNPSYAYVEACPIQPTLEDLRQHLGMTMHSVLGSHSIPQGFDGGEGCFDLDWQEAWKRFHLVLVGDLAPSTSDAEVSYDDADGYGEGSDS